MKSISFYLIITLILSLFNIKKELVERDCNFLYLNPKNKKNLWRIDFHFGFKNDTLSFFYQKDTILNQIILNSIRDPSDTGVSIYCYESDNTDSIYIEPYFFFNAIGRKFYYHKKELGDTLVFDINLNNHLIHNKVSLENGNFIGITCACKRYIGFTSFKRSDYYYK